MSPGHSARRRLIESLAATSLAALAAGAFDLAFHSASGLLPPPLYPPLYFAATLAIAFAAALAGAVAGGPAVALAAWTAANGAALSGPGLAAGFFVATAVPLALARSWARHPRSRALFVGTLAALLLIGWSRYGSRLPLVHVAFVREIAAPSLLLAAVLAAAGAHAALAERRRLPGPAWATAAALLAALVSTGLARHSRPDTDPPRHATTEARAGSGPDVLLIVLDTVRADHLSLYGYARDTTPRLDAFAAASDRAVVYPLAHAPASWTVPSHASLFTGLLPSQHGVHEGVVFPGPRVVEPPPLAAERTLAELMHRAGWRTACVYANGWLRRMPGLSRGFDWWFQPLRFFEPELAGAVLRQKLLPHSFLRDVSAVGPTAPEVSAAVLRFLDACEPGPCFVVANYLDAHGPYLPSPPFADRYEPHGWPPGLSPASMADSDTTLRQREARYDEEIRQLDAAIGDLLDALAARGVLDRAWLVITSDHGEAFDEHGVTEHGTTLYGELTHIPLLIQPPRGTTLPPSAGAVGLVDVTATFAALAGEPSFGVGRNLAVPLPSDHPVQLEFYGDPEKARQHGAAAAEPARAVVRGALKLIERGGHDELYRLDTDPAEQKDLAAEDAATVEAMKPLLPELTPYKGGPARALRPSAEDEKALRALGYVE